MSQRTILKKKQEFPASIESRPDSALFDLDCLKALTGKCRGTIYLWVKKGILPPPLKLGATRNQWNAGEVRAALGIKQQEAA